MEMIQVKVNTLTPTASIQEMVKQKDLSSRSKQFKHWTI